jgi:hypothetical protein
MPASVMALPGIRVFESITCTGRETPPYDSKGVVFAWRNTLQRTVWSCAEKRRQSSLFPVVPIRRYSNDILVVVIQTTSWSWLTEDSRGLTFCM